MRGRRRRLRGRLGMSFGTTSDPPATRAGRFGRRSRRPRRTSPRRIPRRTARRSARRSARTATPEHDDASAAAAATAHPSTGKPPVPACSADGRDDRFRTACADAAADETRTRSPAGYTSASRMSSATGPRTYPAQRSPSEKRRARVSGARLASSSIRRKARRLPLTAVTRPSPVTWAPTRAAASVESPRTSEPE